MMSSLEKIDKIKEAIEQATDIVQERYGYNLPSHAYYGTPLFAEIVKYFLEDEAETKQLLKD